MNALNYLLINFLIKKGGVFRGALGTHCFRSFLELSAVISEALSGALSAALSAALSTASSKTLSVAFSKALYQTLSKVCNPKFGFQTDF